MRNNGFLGADDPANGRILFDPCLLPIGFGSDANAPNIQFKVAAAVNNTATNGCSPMYPQGAGLNSVLTTLQTLANVTGPGVLSAVLAPTTLTSGATVTVKITIDGVLYTFVQTFPASGDRLIIGAVLPGGANSTSATAPIGSALNGVATPFDQGFGTKKGTVMAYGAGSNAGVVIPTTDECLNYGLPVVRFFESLLVQTQISVAPTGSTLDGSQVALYRLDQNS